MPDVALWSLQKIVNLKTLYRLIKWIKEKNEERDEPAEQLVSILLRGEDPEKMIQIGS